MFVRSLNHRRFRVGVPVALPCLSEMDCSQPNLRTHWVQTFV